jgi:hypothetical protein
MFQHIPSIYNSTLSYNIGLHPYIVTDAVRIYPETSTTAACFRMELTGCNPSGNFDVENHMILRCFSPLFLTIEIILLIS